MQLFCELQRDWQRSATVPAFIDLFGSTGGTTGIQFCYDRAQQARCLPGHCTRAYRSPAAPGA